MAEATQGSPAEDTAPAETPANLTAEQVSAIVTQAIDARMPGYMSTVDKRINKLQDDVRVASMTQQEIEQQEQEEEAEELARLRRENAILVQGTEMPEAVRAFQELNAKESGKEQLEYLQSLINPTATGDAAPAADGDAQDEGDDTAPVDNNAGSQPTPDLDVEQAGGILDQFKEWPGADFFKR